MRKDTSLQPKVGEPPDQLEVCGRDQFGMDKRGGQVNVGATVRAVPYTGKVVNLALETGGANALYRLGWKKEDLPVGEVVFFEGWQARNGSATANVNGRRLLAGTSNSAAPEQ
jgi:hypothetical protein